VFQRSVDYARDIGARRLGVNVGTGA